MHKIPKPLRLILASILIFLGVIFILVPGPAILFLPLGLALLSLDYPWARSLLKKCQKLMTRSAKQMDDFVLIVKRYFKKR